jgi:chromosome segregation ATPase
MSSNIQQLEQRSSQLERELNESKQRSSQLERELNEYKQRSSQLERELNESKQRNSQYQNESAQLKQENQQIKQQLIEAQNKIMSHNSNITSYAKEIENREKTIDRLKYENGQLSQRSDRAVCQRCTMRVN